MSNGDDEYQFPAHIPPAHIERHLRLKKLADAAGLSIEDVLSGIEAIEAYSPRGRRLRRRADRPHPDRPSDAPDNRNKKQVSLTLTPGLIAYLNERCQELGVDRNSYIEFAIIQALRES